MTTKRHPLIEQLESRTLLSVSLGTPAFSAGGPESVDIQQTVTPAVLAGVGLKIHATAGVAFTREVAFYPSPVLDPPDVYTATINWGDGTASTTATLKYGSRNAVGGYEIIGSHNYANPGKFTTTITVLSGPIITTGPSSQPTAIVATITGKAVVAPPPNSPGGATIHETAGVAFSADLGSFTTTAPATGLTAVINWGDGTTSVGQLAPVTVVGTNANELTFDVIGSHTYALAGVYPIQIVVSEPSPVAGAVPVALATIQSTGIVRRSAFSVAGTITGTYRLIDISPDGKTYEFTGTGTAGALGSVTETGTITSPGLGSHDFATGRLTLTNADGSVTLELTGPTETIFGPIPGTLAFTIISATGIYAGDTASGSIAVTLMPSTISGGVNTFKLVIS